MEIGIDSIENSRFQDIIYNPKLMKKIFTDEEVAYCIKKCNPSQHFAARFAAKEAVRKALYSNEISIPFNQIEILNNDHGRPYVNITNEKGKNIAIKISISHNFTMSYSVALIYKKGDQINE